MQVSVTVVENQGNERKYMGFLRIRELMKIIFKKTQTNFKIIWIIWWEEAVLQMC